MIGTILKDVIVLAVTIVAVHYLFKFMQGTVRFVLLVVIVVISLNFLGFSSTAQITSFFTKKEVEEKRDAHDVEPIEELQQDYEFILEHGVLE